MPKRLKDADGLSPQEAQFAKYLCQGMTQIDAFRKTWPKSRAARKTADEKASRLANSPGVKARCREILASMKLSDLDSGPQAFKDLLSALERANAVGNFTAVAQLSRLRLDCLGLLKSSTGDRTALSVISDENLLERLAGTNAALRKELEKLLGSESFEKPAAAAPAAPIPTVAPASTTKH